MLEGKYEIHGMNYKLKLDFCCCINEYWDLKCANEPLI